MSTITAVATDDLYNPCEKKSWRIVVLTGKSVRIQFPRSESFFYFYFCRRSVHGRDPMETAKVCTYIFQDFLDFLFNALSIQSTLALRTPRYYGHPANTDSCKIPGLSCRRLTETNSRYCGFSLYIANLRTLCSETGKTETGSS